MLADFMRRFRVNSTLVILKERVLFFGEVIRLKSYDQRVGWLRRGP
jgi:hypothetical protein